MKKVSFVFICIFLMLLSSCLADPEPTEKVIAVNQTNEDVEIYYLSHQREHYETTVYSDDTKEIKVYIDKLYFARGKSSNKEYGSRTFVEVPSYVYDKQTWVIR